MRIGIHSHGGGKFAEAGMKDMFEDGGVQPFLVAEMVVDGGDIDPGALGDPADRGCLESLPAEDIPGGLEDPFFRAR
jgi:hypothetical protein